MNRVHSARRAFDKLKTRLKNRSDSEHEQASIRIVLSVLIIGYVLTLGFSSTSTPTLKTILWMFFFFISAAVLLFVEIILRPAESPVRRYLGIALDLLASTIALGISGEYGAPILALYLWVILGNGFRYGNKYLAVATVAGLLGFSCVYLLSDYWNHHAIFSVSFIIVLIVLPAYVSTLINKLTDAIRRANAANEEKSRFLAKMSHELRTPLNGVIGMSDLLMDSHLAPRQYGFARTIQSSASTLLEIIENILDFSKIEAGRIAIETIDFDLHELIRNTTQMFRAQVERKGLELSLYVDPSVPFSLRGDPLHLRQILTNILDNAVKFTEKGKIDVRIAPVQYLAKSNQILLKFEIEDTGIGIAEQDLGRIFESFQQAENSTSRLYGGTGLGTAISRELARLMGGDIDLRSSLGKGATFTIQLPFKQNPSTHQSTNAALCYTRVLIIGNDGTSMNAIQSALGNWHVNYSVAPSCTQAYEELRKARDTEAPYRLLFVMAAEIDMDPTKFGKMIQADVLHSMTELVLIASHREKRTDQFWHDAGYSTVLHQPLDTLLLFNTIHVANSEHEADHKVVSLSEHYRKLTSNRDRSLHILVAEDNETNQLVLEEILTRIGHRATIVGDGEAALDAIDEHPSHFDLLILDKNMPYRSGLDVFRAYCFMNPDHRAPCILLTADATSNSIQECKDAGIDAYLTKPVNTNKLLNTIALLDHRVSKGKDPESQPESQIPEPTPTDIVVDQQKVASLCSLGLGSAFFEKLVDGFLKDSRKSTDNVALALEEEDFPALRDALHALKGSAEELGAVLLVAVCDKLRMLKPYELSSSEAIRLLSQLRQTIEETEYSLRNTLQTQDEAPTEQEPTLVEEANPPYHLR